MQEENELATLKVLIESIPQVFKTISDNIPITTTIKVQGECTKDCTRCFPCIFLFNFQNSAMKLPFFYKQRNLDT